MLAGGSGLGLSGRQGCTRGDVQPSAARQGLSQHTRTGSCALSKAGFGESVPCGDSLHTRAALAEETPLAQAQWGGGSLADTSLNLELDATLQKAP